MGRKIKGGPRKGLVITTGNGKGKTTAALGLMFRSLGRGLRVVMLQFIKSRENLYGEHLLAEQLGVEIVPPGDGFTWELKNIEFDKELIEFTDLVSEAQEVKHPFKRGIRAQEG